MPYPSSSIDSLTFGSALLTWFDQHGRKTLPWQRSATPYGIWVSEIMLQQTQVATVIPYYERFMKRFPTLTSLADADTADVMAHWAGLGYYARARNLHHAARLLCNDDQDQVPAEMEQLLRLPGIGRSTAGAILSMAFGIRAPILDGNVKRVLARYAGVTGWPGQSSVLQQLWDLAERLTPENRVGEYTQAMMDLGATVCTRRNPECGRCPLRTCCQALLTDSVHQLPTLKPRKTLSVKTSLLLVLRNAENHFLLERRPSTGIWGGLWSLPEFTDREALTSWCMARAIDPAKLESLPLRRHTFSHFHLDYTPVFGRVGHISRIEDHARTDWLAITEATALPAPIRQLLTDLTNHLDHTSSP